MKKSIGNTRSLYPSPTCVVGLYHEEKVNFINLTHTGIVGSDMLMLSMKKVRHSANMLKISSFISVNVVDESWLCEADFCGMVSGKNVDKAKVIKYQLDEEYKVPIINLSKVSMVCEVVDDYQTQIHHQWMVKISKTLVEEEYINDKNLVDFAKFKPVLFDNENWIYIATGEVLGGCASFGKDLCMKMKN